MTSPGIDRLTIAPASIEITVGSTVQLRASAFDPSGGSVALGGAVWSVSDPNVVQVDNAGMLTGLAVGVAAVTVRANGVSAAAPVNVRAVGSLSLSDSVVALEADQGGPDPAPVTLRIGSSGAASQGLNAQVVHRAGQPFGWLIATLSSPNGPADLEIQGRVSALPAGEYDAEIRVSAQGSAAVSVVRVTMLVRDPNPAIGVQSDTVRLVDADQAARAVTNAGGGTLSGLTTRIRYVGGARTWLSASLSNSVAPTTLSLNSVPTGLAAGSYSAFVDILSSIPGVTTATIPVVLDVGSTSPVIRLTPQRADLVFQTGGSAPTATIQVANQAGGSLSGLTKAVSYAPNEPVGWLSATLSSATGPTTLQLLTVPGSLTLGTYSATVEVAGAGAAAVLLPVILTVSAGAPVPPAAPSGLAGSPQAAVVDLSWTDNSNNETRFEVERASGGAFARIGSPGVNATSFSDTVVNSGTGYQYRVRACNSAGCSAFSNTISVTTPVTVPAAPSALTGSAGASGIALAWTDNANNETRFEVQRATGGSFSALASPSANATAYTDNTVSAGTTYQYRVRACNTAGCSPFSNTVSVTQPVAVPDPPSGLAGSVAGSAVDLTWTDNSNNETDFEVERAPSGGAFANLASLGANTTAYTDGSVAAGTTYEYRVRACNAAGCSAYSNAVSVTTPTALPDPPTGLTATPSASQVDLSWTDNSSNETSFQVERASGGGAFATIGTASANATSFVDGSVTAGASYDYRVAACNAQGCSAYSNTASATIPSATPPRPASLTAVVLSAIDIDLSWPDVAGETSYEIQQQITGSTWGNIATVAANVVTLSVTGLAPGTEYRFRIRACNAAGCSGRRASARVTTQNPTQFPADPSGLQFVGTPNSSQVVLSWTDNSTNETRFEIEEGGPFSNWTKIGEVGVNVTTFTDTNVLRFVPIQYRVRACNPFACSPPSPAITTIVP